MVKTNDLINYMFPNHDCECLACELLRLTKAMDHRDTLPAEHERVENIPITWGPKRCPTNE